MLVSWCFDPSQPRRIIRRLRISKLVTPRLRERKKEREREREKREREKKREENNHLQGFMTFLESWTERDTR